MIRLTLDASVVVKWALPDPAGEDDVPAALAILSAIRSRDVEVLEPPHWLAEVAAVVSRLRPSSAADVTLLLHALELPVAGDVEVYLSASRLAVDLGHHLFDTLYHAVALTYDGTLVTADRRYYEKARRFGRIVRLEDLDLTGSRRAAR